jgi:uncharacterized protein YqjF (DUF2071 family)
VPFHRDFEEVNLRFYVRREAADEVRRGVVFLRELVPRALIALLAKAWYNEPYRSLPMRHSVEHVPAGGGVSAHYGWRLKGAWEGITLRADGAPEPLRTGSLAEFITEHYWGYTKQRDGSTFEYKVTHPRWRVRTAQDALLLGDLPALYGHEFGAALTGPPVSAFWAEGSEVTVFRPARIPAGAA